MGCPGSFYQTGIVPGEYEAYASLENGREVLLPQTVSVGINPEFGLTLSMPGSLFMGNLTNETGAALANTSFEITDKLSENAPTTTVTTNETGGYKYGPVSSGEYEYRIDLDSDGFYEVSGALFVGNETELFEPLSTIPDTYDLTIELVTPMNELGEPLVETGNQNFTVTDAFGVSENYVSDALGDIDMELTAGDYTIEQANLSDFYLYSSFTVSETSDLSLELEYSPATTINGKILAYTVEYDDSWSEEQIAANATVATQLDVTFTSGDLTLDTTTDNDGNFSIVVPGDLVYTMKAATTTNTYGVGMFVTPNEEATLDIGEVYLKRLTTVTGTLNVSDTNLSWNAQNYDGLNPTIVAIDEMGVEWEALVSNSGSFTMKIADGIYDFSGSESEYNITVIEDFEVRNFVGSSSISLTANLEPVELQVSVCLVPEDSGDCSQGIPKFADVEIISMFDNSDYFLNQTNFDGQGIANVDVMPGRYMIQTRYTDASDENATDFNTFSTNQEIFVSMFTSENDVIAIELSDERLFSGRITAGAENFSGVQFLLFNESNDQFLSATTDSDGNFSEYIPSGDWLVIISPQNIDNKTFTCVSTVGMRYCLCPLIRVRICVGAPV
ncbi:MAG: hypothetical protein VXY53_01455 [Candidatus Thermoplasmatota archaeon]|nr:hypothetical protein [Candidatus Thermoplasmatota archaeon]